MLSLFAKSLSPHDAVGTCAHCATPLTAHEVTGPDDLRFCCAGCSTVYAAINAAGLADFYKDRELTGDAAPARPSGRRFAEFDDAALVPLFVSHPDGTFSADLTLEGVHCAACVWLVERLPRVLPGVRESRLDFGRRTATIRWAPEEAKLSAVGAALDRLGYTPHLPGAGGSSKPIDRALLMRMGVAGAVAGNVMLMALALYSGAASGVDGDYATFFRWGSLLLSLPAVFYCAAVFYRGAWASILTRTPNMDLPIAFGISAGFVSGAVNTLRGRGEIYFDTVAVLIFLLLVGRWLGQRQQRRAATAADFALALAPATARVVVGEERREVLAGSVQKDALVEVRPRERVPVDGRIAGGESSLDVRLLTGESSAVEVKTGDRVYAGTENLSASLLVRCERAGGDTRVGQLVRSMERAQRERAPIVRVADRIAGLFVLIVMGLAVLTLALWWHVGPAIAVEHAVALLVVTCPCALGMATPLSVSVALARAARRGILIKNGELLEALAEPSSVVFDKTGTLTTGRAELLEWQGEPSTALRASVAENGCDHPLARGFQRAFPAPPELSASAVERLPGAGVKAIVDGHALLVGTLALLLRENVAIAADVEQRVMALAAGGSTPVLVAEDGRFAGLAAFGDAIRVDATTSLPALRARGVSLSILSGDHPLVVERVARAVDVSSFRGGVSPEQKLDDIRARVARGERVIMVGDGVNDAAAMSAATVGFAVHGGAEASLLAAGVFATEPGVAPVLEAIDGAQKTLRAIHRGLAFSLAYNAAGVVLAMTGMLSPLIAAVMMPLSSITVLASSLHSRAFSGESKARAPGGAE